MGREDDLDTAAGCRPERPEKGQRRPGVESVLDLFDAKQGWWRLMFQQGEDGGDPACALGEHPRGNGKRARTAATLRGHLLQQRKRYLPLTCAERCGGYTADAGQDF